MSDPRLRGLFEALRRSDRARTPDFETSWAASQAGLESPTSMGWRAGFAAAATIVLVIGAYVLGNPGHDEPFGQDVYSVGGWSTPTDALLSTPGQELLGSPLWESPAVFDLGLDPQSRTEGRSHG